MKGKSLLFFILFFLCPVLLSAREEKIFYTMLEVTKAIGKISRYSGQVKSPEIIPMGREDLTESFLAPFHRQVVFDTERSCYKNLLSHIRTDGEPREVHADGSLVPAKDEQILRYLEDGGILIVLKITFVERQREQHNIKAVSCTNCHGTGSIRKMGFDKDTTRTCPMCQGTGKVSQEQMNIVSQRQVASLDYTIYHLAGVDCTKEIQAIQDTYHLNVPEERLVDETEQRKFLSVCGCAFGEELSEYRLVQDSIIGDTIYQLPNQETFLYFDDYCAQCTPRTKRLYRVILRKNCSSQREAMQCLADTSQYLERYYRTRPLKISRRLHRFKIAVKERNKQEPRLITVDLKCDFQTRTQSVVALAIKDEKTAKLSDEERREL